MTRAEVPEQIETERLVLRVRRVADAEDIHAYASLPEVAYPAGFPPVKTLEDEIYYLEHILPERNQKDNLPAGYGIVVKGTDKIIGSVDFNHRHEDDVLEIGYTLHPDYWGRGYVRPSLCNSSSTSLLFKHFIFNLPLTLQQTIYQTVTAVSLGIFAVPYASFEGKAKLHCNSLTLDIGTKARQFYLVKTQFFES